MILRLGATLLAIAVAWVVLEWLTAAMSPVLLLMLGFALLGLHFRRSRV